MPPTKVIVFVLSLAFILFVGFLMWDPSKTQEISCENGELHSHDGGPEHCD